MAEGEEGEKTNDTQSLNCNLILITFTGLPANIFQNVNFRDFEFFAIGSFFNLFKTDVDLYRLDLNSLDQR